MKNKLFILFLINIFTFISCDILRSSLFEVTSWTPGNGYQSEPEKIIVSLDFSGDPDMASIEKNFSLTGDGNKIRGNFLWDGRKMTFAPLIPLEINIDYAISLSADAHDTKGLSMDEAFKQKFSTRPENTRPVLISNYPEMYAEVSDPKAEIKLEFSIPITLKTIYDNVFFVPSMTGIWRLENDEKLAIFTPIEAWSQQTRYEIKYSSSLTANNGMNIRNDFSCVFTIISDIEIPYLVNAKRITNKNESFLLSPNGRYTGASELPVENYDWEKDDKLTLVFSRPVDSITVKNYLSVDDGPNLIMETLSGYKTEFTFRFDIAPAYESRFLFRIKPGIKDAAGNESKEEYSFRIFANGKHSKPPTLAGIRIPMAPNSGTDKELKLFKADSLFSDFPITDVNYPSGENIISWIELYFETAEEAFIDLFSFMELFRIDTSNNVISFSPRQMKNTNFTIPYPHNEMEGCQRIEITGTLTNSTNFGIINILIAAGLKDTLGNRNDKSLKISLVK
ncbi:hypothetical protein R84B8_00855 [Treponema sp. R8-4-B8]